eukprot:TRINITY_DN103602_c0_g1_i1.p1 TRINITY_DN103602_c0_g1~~TRINITY_DN103602_c0_g1_i1.p1  ORF type:complete len:469 (-),score=54.03 TRINITY_DN103602_c0_g1_i1:25-1359(-)
MVSDLRFPLPSSPETLQDLADSIQHPMTPAAKQELINNVRQYATRTYKKKQLQAPTVYPQGSLCKHTDTIHSDVDIVIESPKGTDLSLTPALLEQVAQDLGGIGIWKNKNCVGFYLDGHEVELVPAEQGTVKATGPAQTREFLAGGMRQLPVLLRCTRLIKYFVKQNGIEIKSCCLEMLVRCALDAQLQSPKLPLPIALNLVLDFFEQLSVGDTIEFEDDYTQTYNKFTPDVVFKVTIPVTSQDVGEKVTPEVLQDLNRIAKAQLELFGVSPGEAIVDLGALEELQHPPMMESTNKQPLNSKTLSQLATPGLSPFGSTGGLYGKNLGLLVPSTQDNGSDVSSDTASTIETLESAERAISALTKTEIMDGKNLAVLDDQLHQLHKEQGVTMTKMRQVIAEFGYCLTNCKKYGSELRTALRKNKKLIIHKAQAKEYSYVKKCLIML